MFADELCASINPPLPMYFGGLDVTSQKGISYTRFHVLFSSALVANAVGQFDLKAFASRSQNVLKQIKVTRSLEHQTQTHRSKSTFSSPISVAFVVV